ncbi:MAG TPA: hypothetical protein VFQ80_10295, partial [Thermomicrobiales bacterium]|nr:hypothetical protein [Thermomicrobiales bacterium]
MRRARSRRRHRRAVPAVAGVWLLLAGLLSGLAPAAPVGAAPPCLTDAEPNDTPEAAMTLTGAGCLAGTLGDADQDLVLWTVAPADAAKRWTIALQGAPATLTSVKVFPVTSAPGETPVAVGGQLFALDHAPDATQTAQ